VDQEINELKGVGKVVAQKLNVLGIKKVEDLIFNFPRRYDDYSTITLISMLRPGQVTVKAKLISANGRYVRRGLHITEAIVKDSSGSLRLVWFNQPYRASSLKKNAVYFVSGKFEMNGRKFGITNPSIELESNLPINTARIIPVYRETKGLKSFTVRKIMAQLLNEIEGYPDPMPAEIIDQNNLLNLSDALKRIHFPAKMIDIERAKKRLGFDELFALILAGMLVKQENDREKALPIVFKKELAQKFVKSLPFKLTDSQRIVVWQIYKDIAKDQPMNRLVEGDVGSGKTVIATMAGLMAVAEGFQVALMAPTEILARQHANSIKQLLKSHRMAKEVVLLIGGLSPTEKANAHKQIANGSAKFIIGTHAIISEKVDIHKLALIIVDEQHRFGVEHRQKLQKKAGHMPHILSMTATPIPRTLALTVYGELDISVLTDMPPGRKTVITKLVSPNDREKLYKGVDRMIGEGHQAFIVCPLVSESSAINVLSAEEVYDKLSKGVFRHRRVGLLHGQMKTKDKDQVMKYFISGSINVLVTTTVIEVGVDVKDANVMIVENAERFGLAQIHQLRGRVGRAGEQAYCYLIKSDNLPPSRRLRAIEQSANGFKLAELDLEIRGPGAIYGKSQHGQLDLRIANFTDTRLISLSRAAARQFIEDKYILDNYPVLSKRVKDNQFITNLN